MLLRLVNEPPHVALLVRLEVAPTRHFFADCMDDDGVEFARLRQLSLKDGVPKDQEERRTFDTGQPQSFVDGVGKAQWLLGVFHGKERYCKGRSVISAVDVLFELLVTSRSQDGDIRQAPFAKVVKDPANHRSAVDRDHGRG